MSTDTLAREYRVQHERVKRTAVFPKNDLVFVENSRQNPSQNQTRTDSASYSFAYHRSHYERVTSGVRFRTPFEPDSQRQDNQFPKNYKVLQ